MLMVAINVIGLGGGPLFVGWLSDMLNPTYGPESLRLALQSVVVVGIPAATLLFFASRSCRADFEKAGGWSNDAPLVTSLH